MKKILIATLVLAAGIGSAFAQKPADCPTTCTNGQQCTQAVKPRTPRPCINAFEGLNLTADQQAKIDALKTECQTRRDQAKAEQKADRQKERADRAANFKANRTEMLAKIKDILTPEQYVQFLENNFVNAPQGNGGKFAKAAKATNSQKPARKAPTNATTANKPTDIPPTRSPRG